MINTTDAYNAVACNGHINLDLKKYLLNLIRKDEASRLLVREGDVVKIDNKIFVIAKIVNLFGHPQIEQSSIELLAVLYSPIKKVLEFAWESVYTDPSKCEIISHIDPKQIFREDIKI